jgi:hypothetical protein
MGAPKRWITDALVFLIPAVAATAAVFIIGDKAPDDSVIVHLNQGDQ